MDYYNKYIKYKTKYLELKYDNNQYGGVIVPCNKGINNFIGTCWAVAIHMILFFGHLTSEEFYKIMEQFKISTIAEERITLRDSFIEEQIERVDKDLHLYDFLPAYIFKQPKRYFLKIMLTKIIDRYNSKVFESPITIKPSDINDKTNPQRCETVISENYKKLFDYEIINYGSNQSGGAAEQEGYLFCNLLSIIFLKHKVSFTNYYNNFSLIDFKDETDLGILITIEGHVCCLFICNGKGQYYNDNDKQIYTCDWKELLNTTATNLYVKRYGCLQFIDDSTIDMNDEALISKVLYLTKISKYEKDSELDNDILKALTLTHTETIRDPNLLLNLGEMYYWGKGGIDKDLTKAFDFYTRCVNNGGILPRVYSALGDMYYNGTVVKKDLKKAFDLFTISVNNRLSHPFAYYMLGTMYEDGINTTVNLKEAFKLYTQAINFAIKKKLIYQYTTLCVKLGNMHENGLDIPVNLEKAFELYTLAMNNGNKTAYVKLGNMYENGTGTPKNLEKAFELYTLGEKNHDKSAYFYLGNMYENGLGIQQDLVKAVDYYLTSDETDARSYTKLGNMLENGRGVPKDLRNALRQYTSARKKGDKTVYTMLANMYEQQPDAPENVETYMVLGEQYEKGENIKKDYKKAFNFYKKAKLLGHEPANESITRIFELLPELRRLK